MDEIDKILDSMNLPEETREQKRESANHALKVGRMVEEHYQKWGKASLAALVGSITLQAMSILVNEK